MMKEAFTEINNDVLGLHCGPPPMNKSVRENFIKLGLKEENIFKFWKRNKKRIIS